MRTFRSLRHRDYRLYFAGQLVSLVGSWTQFTALMWLAHEQTNAVRWPAFLAAAQIGPTFLLGPWGGALADRVAKKGLILRTQAVFFCCALGLLTLHATGLLTVWAMLAVMLVHGIVQAIDLPTRLAFVPGLVDRVDLPNAVALNSLLFNVARALGPAVAALLLAVSGPRGCFLANAGSYLVIILAISFIRAEGETTPTEAPRGGGGFKVLARTPGLLGLVVITGVAAGGGWPLLALLPRLADQVLRIGEEGYGTLLSSVGIGALLAALTAASLGEHAPRRAILMGGLAIVIAGLGVLSRTEAIETAATGCVLFGFGMILFLATGQTLVQLSTRDENRGKVMGVWAMMLSAGVPLGNLVFGPLADYWQSVRAVITVQTATITLAALCLLLFLRSRTWQADTLASASNHSPT